MPIVLPLREVHGGRYVGPFEMLGWMLLSLHSYQQGGGSRARKALTALLWRQPRQWR